MTTSTHTVKAKNLRANDIILVDGFMQQIHDLTTLPSVREIYCTMKSLDTYPVDMPDLRLPYDLKVSVHMTH